MVFRGARNIIPVFTARDHGPSSRVVRTEPNSTTRRKQFTRNRRLETVSIAEPLQNRQHAPLMLSTLGSKEKREGG